jgi:L-ascorbate metabolism protein UlaG (beta-lactamase superfamily)
MAKSVRDRKFEVRKLGQLMKIVRDSHEQPLKGETKSFKEVRPDEVGVTFIGHSSFLLQIGGKNVLVDPVFATRLVILRRQRRPGLTVPTLPPIDLVLITHAHMDHLNLPSLRWVARATKELRGFAPTIVVPDGVEDLVDRSGFARVYGMSWWQERRVAGLRVIMTPCRHWGARMFKDTHRGYGGYCITDPTPGSTMVYHSGDTAYFDGFKEIGHRLQPDVGLMPIGAYFPDTHRTVHTSPEEAVRGFIETGAEWMVPMHFGTFPLGREPMDEPVKRLRAEARRLKIEDRVKVLEEGEMLRVKERPEPDERTMNHDSVRLSA